MINFINSWAQSIIIAVIISTIIEMILPDGNIKKYVRSVIGTYMVFVIISPIISKVTGKEVKLEMYEYPETNEYAISSIDTNAYIEDTYINSIKQEVTNNMKAKGQPLFCGRWCPDWVPQDYEKLKELWIKYVKAVAEKYDGAFSIFDVVNESYQSNGTWKNMDWLPVPVHDFVQWLLNTAGDIFSDQCVMERNEASRVNYGEYADIYYEENKKLLEDGVRLDSIGFQFHFFNGASCLEKHISGVASLENIYQTYQKMSTLGIPLYITEITIPSVYENMSIQEGEELQAEILEKLYRLWFSVPNMKGIIYWNLKDGDVWKKEGDCRGCLIDEYLRKKKSYYTLEHLIKREWNTSFSSKTRADGSLDFSGF